MVVTDPSIDPVTGLPVLNPSGPVQQIPLGQEVFPYADLNATAQPTRGPIYGDDIIPTSSLITAPDDQLKPRSIQSTRTRELRVREAVFQNLGAAIPDGTTAPIDVNVIGDGGGGGGNGPVAMKHYSDSVTTNNGAITQSGFVTAPTTIWGVGYYATPGNVMPVNSSYVGEFWVGFGADGNLPLVSPLFILPPQLTYTGVDLGGSGKPYVVAEVWFPSGWNPVNYLHNGNLYIYLRGQNYNLDTDVHVYYT
jgi:hypothetical protein